MLGTNLGASSAAKTAFWNEVATVEYQNHSIAWKDNSDDILKPGVLEANYKIGYVQSRQEPNRAAH